MKKIILPIILLAFIVSAYRIIQEKAPVLPPATVNNDREQIEILVSTLNHSIVVDDQVKLNAILPQSMSILEKTDQSILSSPISSIEIRNVIINKDSALAVCNVLDCGGSVLREINILFEKDGYSWLLKSSNVLIDIIKSNRIMRGQNKMYAVNFSSGVHTPQRNILSPATLIIKNNMLKNIIHPWSYERVINAKLTSETIERRLFGDDTRMDVDALYTDYNPDNAISFHLDHIWSRIMYGKKSENWIRSYGDHPLDYRFNNPKGMCVDVNDTVYVADTDRNKIVKLAYSSGYLHHVCDFTVSGLSHPIDLDIYQNPSLAGNPQSDTIWIADDFAGKIIGITRDGIVRKSLEYYFVPGIGTSRLNDPIKVLSLARGKIAFIDRERMAFVTVHTPAYGGTVANTLYYTEFDRLTSELTCIGQDINNELWVGDSKQKLYHHFTVNGEYIASYRLSDNPLDNFKSPVSISKAPYYKSETPSRCQYIYTSDLWGWLTGMQAFLPWAEAFNLSFRSWVDDCNSGVDFTLTNQSYVQGRLTIPPETTTVAFFDYGVLAAGKQTVKIDKFKFSGSDTYYKFQIELRPRYWESSCSYGFSCSDWLLYPINFTTSAPTSWGARIEAIPLTATCVSSNSTGQWKVIPMCPTGFYKYKWYEYDDLDENQWVYLGGNVNPLITSGGMFQIRCDVEHLGGQTRSAYYDNCPLPPPPPPSCPFVYTWDGVNFIEDNNIIPQSEYEDNEGKDVTDYYRLLKPLKVDDGKYIIQIREYEHEQSYFNQFKLLVVDHSANTKIDVSQTGKIFEYVNPDSLSNAKLKGKDVLQQLRAVDSNHIIVYPGDTLSIAKTSNSKYDRTIQSTIDGEASGDLLPKVDKIGIVDGPRGVYSNKTGFTFRQRPTLVYLPSISDNSGLANIVWTQKARLDYFNYAVSLKSSYQLRELNIYSCEHSIFGDVKKDLIEKDSSYSTLNSGEAITLKFNAPPPPNQKMKRSFILISVGRYITLSDSSGSLNFLGSQNITNYKIGESYPNPFNPITSINIQLPKDGHAVVIIYNTLGQEVARLIDQDVLRGSYTVKWTARDVPSGMYFCRFEVTNDNGRVLYSETKKMLMLK
ncbi:MAG: hypothetical protein C0417_13245 [Chlorobiaceae bacterium]|nr:hypothetical protein [Chlorobiaceae bacterium]